MKHFPWFALASLIAAVLGLFGLSWYGGGWAPRIAKTPTSFWRSTPAACTARPSTS
jgi:hypothetical protein